MAAPHPPTRPTEPAAPGPSPFGVLRSTLLADLALQEGNVRELRDRVVSLTGQSDVESLHERELAERAVAHGAEVIGDIRDALERMDAGIYGTCEGCGGSIAPARLEAIPFARRCVACPPAVAPLIG